MYDKNAHPLTSGLAQRRRDVQIWKVVQESRRFAKPPSRYLQAGDSVVDKAAWLENGVQSDNEVQTDNIVKQPTRTKKL